LGKYKIQITMKIREIIKLLKADGWYIVAIKGSHQQYKHPTKPGRVTIAGHPGDDLSAGTLNSILKQAKLKKVK
jgi:predicted RNA binding protein YcfA (HicA-like mRNA interferase family)